MKNIAVINHKIFSLPQLVAQVNSWRATGNTIVFTNGCFDILHEGHLYSLQQAAKEGDKLIVAVNSDTSTKELKGPDRPINPEHARAALLAANILVDAVILFNERTPLALIKALLPNVLVKGGDYTIENIVGAKEVINNGGRVVINPLIEGISTTKILEKIISTT